MRNFQGRIRRLMGQAFFEIFAADPRSPEAVELMSLLSAELARLYDFVDDGSGYFQTEDVLVPASGFLIGNIAHRAVACGAYRSYSADVAEIKRMFVIPEFRGRGFSKLVLADLETRARRDGYQYVRLETGYRQPQAISLYEKSGYYRIDNYGPWVGDVRSLCFEKRLVD